jgi:hypothetical protein
MKCLAPLMLASLLCAQLDAGAAVRQTFESYRSAIKDRNGLTAISLVTSATIDSYEAHRDQALYSTRAELEQRPIFERMIVLNFRLRFTLAELQITPGAELFSRGIEQGWTNTAALNDSSLDKLVIGEVRAQAQMVARPGDAGAPIHFALEDGVWKVDLVSLAEAVEASLLVYLTSDDVTEERLVEETLAAAYGKALPDDIWEPLVH